MIIQRLLRRRYLVSERAYSAQLAMMNGRSEFDQLAGVIHRPEGLHRMMNLCLVIAKKFCLLLFMNEKVFGLY